MTERPTNATKDRPRRTQAGTAATEAAQADCTGDRATNGQATGERPTAGGTGTGPPIAGAVHPTFVRARVTRPIPATSAAGGGGDARRVPTAGRPRQRASCQLTI